MEIVRRTLGDLNARVIALGRQGENNARRVEIDAGAWREAWPDARVSAAIQPAGGEARRTAVQYEDSGRIIWPITGMETVEDGYGVFELTLTDAEGAVVKSAQATYYVSKSITGSGTPVQPGEGNAETAERLAEARLITLSGDVTGSAAFDGSRDITLETKIVSGGTIEELSEAETEAILNE